MTTQALHSNNVSKSDSILRNVICFLKNSNANIIFISILSINILLLLWFISETSIYAKEAFGLIDALDSNASIGKELSDVLPYKLALFSLDSIRALGLHAIYNDYAMRLPFLLLHIINCLLLYRISIKMLSRKIDALFCVLVYMLIPGVSVSALAVSNASLLIFLSLLIAYFQVVHNRIAYPIFCVAIVLDSGASILCLALFFYALYYRLSFCIAFSIVCFGINLYLFAPIFGIPHSYFIDSVGFLAVVFTPIFFVYYCTYLYYYTFHSKPNFVNLIPFIGIIFVLLLSTRQHIKVDSFMPFICIGIPTFIDKMSFELRSRLPQFRMKYNVRLTLIVVCLLLGNIVLFGNKLTYYFSQTHNFARSFYFAKDIARELYERDITHIRVDDMTLKTRLEFYGIKVDSNAMYKLIRAKDGSININYGNFNAMSFGIVRNKDKP